MTKYFVLLITLLVGCQSIKETKTVTKGDLVGTWDSKKKFYSTKEFIETRTTYFSNGIWTTLETAQINGEALSLSASGTWELSGEFIITKIEQITDPKMFPVGISLLRAKISEGEITSISLINGETLVSHRVE